MFFISPYYRPYDLKTNKVNKDLNLVAFIVFQCRYRKNYNLKNSMTTDNILLLHLKNPYISKTFEVGYRFNRLIIKHSMKEKTFVAFIFLILSINFRHPVGILVTMTKFLEK